jgi:hypothetical protein
MPQPIHVHWMIGLHKKGSKCMRLRIDIDTLLTILVFLSLARCLQRTFKRDCEQGVSCPLWIIVVMGSHFGIKK